MAKNAYVGVNGVAHKIKRLYVGIPSSEPVYETQIGENVNITSNNLGQYFTVTNGDTYYFVGNGGVFTTNNQNVSSSSATTVLTALTDMQVSFNYSYSTEATYDKFTLVVAGVTVESGASGDTTTKSWSGSLTKGQTISFTYTKDGSVNNNDDQCTFSAMVVAEVRQVIGEDGTTVSTARKVKKGYIGVSGIAQLFYHVATAVQYKSTATSLSSTRRMMGATPVGNYALFAGGANASTTYYSTAYAYNKSLVRSTPTALSAVRGSPAATTVGNKALFAGGQTSSSQSAVVDVYSESLTRGTATSLLVARSHLAATTVGSYGLVAGGATSDGTSNLVDAYDTSLTRIDTLDVLKIARSSLAAATVGGYALFAGGSDANSTKRNNIDVYDSSLTKISTSLTLGVERDRIQAARAGDYAIFGGGYTTTRSAETDAFDASLTKVDINSLLAGVYYHAATELEDFAIFAGGYATSSSGAKATATVFDKSLTRTNPGDLSVARYYLTACQVGDYALFAGGQTDSTTLSSTVDVYEIA